MFNAQTTGDVSPDELATHSCDSGENQQHTDNFLQELPFHNEFEHGAWLQAGNFAVSYPIQPQSLNSTTSGSAGHLQIFSLNANDPNNFVGPATSSPAMHQGGSAKSGLDAAILEANRKRTSFKVNQYRNRIGLNFPAADVTPLENHMTSLLRSLGIDCLWQINDKGFKLSILSKQPSALVLHDVLGTYPNAASFEIRILLPPEWIASIHVSCGIVSGQTVALQKQHHNNASLRSMIEIQHLLAALISVGLDNCERRWFDISCHGSAYTASRCIAIDHIVWAQNIHKNGNDYASRKRSKQRQSDQLNEEPPAYADNLFHMLFLIDVTLINGVVISNQLFSMPFGHTSRPSSHMGDATAAVVWDALVGLAIATDERVYPNACVKDQAKCCVSKALVISAYKAVAQIVAGQQVNELLERPSAVAFLQSFFDQWGSQTVSHANFFGKIMGPRKGVSFWTWSYDTWRLIRDAELFNLFSSSKELLYGFLSRDQCKTILSKHEGRSIVRFPTKKRYSLYLDALRHEDSTEIQSLVLTGEFFLSCKSPDQKMLLQSSILAKLGVPREQLAVRLCAHCGALMQDDQQSAAADLQPEDGPSTSGRTQPPAAAAGTSGSQQYYYFYAQMNRVINFVRQRMVAARHAAAAVVSPRRRSAGANREFAGE